jgi:hypothetical protein
MHRIINTTDGKFKGRLIDINHQFIVLDDFLFKIQKLRYGPEGLISLSNDNYTIDVKLESENE